MSKFKNARELANIARSYHSALGIYDRCEKAALEEGAFYIEFEDTHKIVTSSVEARLKSDGYEVHKKVVDKLVQAGFGVSTEDEEYEQVDVVRIVWPNK